jgi:hypothetical protein
MCKKNYPKYFLYDTKIWNINQMLFNSFTKNDWIKELTNVDSNLYFLAKEEIEEFFYNTGGYLTLLDFESCYILAIDATSRQVRKSIKKNKKYFFEIENNNNLLIYKKIKERLLSNLKNLFDKKRRINVLNIDLWLMDNIYESYELDTTTLLDLKKLVNSDPQIIISNIIKLANNFEITVMEIEELGEKLNMNFSTIPELNLSMQSRNLRKNVNNQTYFSFGIEDFEEVA